MVLQSRQVATTDNARHTKIGRARRACEICYTKRIRCSAPVKTPCVNCTRKGVQCAISGPPQTRYNRRSAPDPIQSSSDSEVSPKCDIGDIGLSKMFPHVIRTIPDAEEYAEATQFSALSQDGSAQKADSLDLTLLQLPSPDMPVPTRSYDEHLWNTFMNPDPSDAAVSDTPSIESFLPVFIRPLPKSIDPARVEFLRSNGALTLPCTSLRNALLQAFIRHVFPYTPVIEWHNLLMIVDEGATSSHHRDMSLLLFHAIMFSAAIFVELGQLFRAGYSSRGEALAAFLRKTEILYESDYESDAFTIVQVLLLMTYQFGRADVEASRHWLGDAISVAEQIGLFKNPSSADFQAHSPSLRKRIGWVCYMKDCLISLTLRRPPRIKAVDFSLDMLTEDDFELDCFPLESLVLQFGDKRIPDKSALKDLALICTSNMRLCTCIREVLDTQGSRRRLDIGNDADYFSRVLRSDSELANWEKRLPRSCEYPAAAPNDAKDEDPVLVAHRCLLHLNYHTAIAVLHRSHALPSSGFRVRHAAQQITLLASELHQKGLYNDLPLVGITALMVAMITQVSDMKTCGGRERKQVLQSFHSCAAVVDRLRGAYKDANSVILWTTTAMQRVYGDLVSDDDIGKGF